MDNGDGTGHVENLAKYAHEAWAGWMKYMFGKMTLNEDGSATMSAELRARWTRQMVTPYVKLPEGEKESDRVEARRMLKIMGVDVDEPITFMEEGDNG